MILKKFVLLFLFVQCNGLYSNTSAVVMLDTKNFNRLVKQSQELWLVEFFASWCKHCQNFAKEYERVARAVEGIVKVGAVNAEENPSLAKDYDVQEYPTIKVFNSHNGVPENYRGDYSVDALISYISVELHSKINSRLDGNLDPSMFKSKEIVELSENNFDKLVLSSQQMWLIVYYSPFSEKSKKLSTRWPKVVAELKGLVKFGSLNAILNFHKASESQIEGYPTINFYPPESKKPNSGIMYPGKKRIEDIIQWGFEQVAEHIPNPRIAQIVDFNSLAQACENRPLCVVTILPHISDCPSKCRNDYLDILKEVGDRNRKTLWGWLWSEAGAQPAIENALRLDNSEHPTVAAVNIKQMKYSIFRGALSLDSVNKFLENFSNGEGDEKPIKVKKMPDVDIVEPWDGLDFEPVSSTHEDEFKDEL